MQRTKRMRITVLAMICAAIAGTATAKPLALDPADAERYAAAFDSIAQGDFVDAQIKSVDIQDRALAGHLAFQQLMHPSAHKASFEELAAWLDKYSDLPGADRVHALAARRDPTKAKALKQPLLAGLDWSRIENAARGLATRISGDGARAAREAFYAGDVTRALKLAAASGERWIAGMSAYRLKDYGEAERWLSQVARDGDEDPWLRAGAAFWAARSATQLGDAQRSVQLLRLAARFPETFYGMIAERQVVLQTAETPSQLSQAASTGEFTPVAYTAPDAELSRFIAREPRAHRAAALAQIGRATEAGLELRAGLALASDQAERSLWTSLIMALNAPLSAAADMASAVSRPRVTQISYPTPVLEPKSGFTIDKALVYAIVNQESRFNPEARSPAGATGLMQLMPEAAARAAGDDKLKLDQSPLLDPAFNLRVGQDYVTWLMERGVGYDLLRTVAAYNGGPGTLLRTAQQVGEDDSLLIIESLPAQETRNYVEKVVAGYWTYRKMFGQASPSLDALARGATFVDARLDR